MVAAPTCGRPVGEQEDRLNRTPRCRGITTRCAGRRPDEARLHREPGARRAQPLLQVGDQRGDDPITRELCRRHGTQARRDKARTRVDGRGTQEGMGGRRRLSLWRHHSFAAGDGAATQRSRRDAMVGTRPRGANVAAAQGAHQGQPGSSRSAERPRLAGHRGIPSHRRLRFRDEEGNRIRRVVAGETPARREVRGVWRLHDLRRTVATGMQAAGVLPHTVAAVLNHSTAGLFGVTAIYLRDRQEEAKRAAMRRVGSSVARHPRNQPGNANLR